MVYEYAGYLRGLLEAPDAAVTDKLPAVTFTADDMAAWDLCDDPAEPEWRPIRVNRTRTDQGVLLEGNFQETHAIERLAADEPPGFWVPLTSRNAKDDRFPIDTSQFPVVEVTYRCTSPNARPAWLWGYAGGLHVVQLPFTPDWRTVIRRVTHFGFPPLVDYVTFRVYSTSCSSESIEIKSVRFRAATPDEADRALEVSPPLDGVEKLKKYPILDAFLPIGCFMDAASTKRLAAMLGVSLHEYWLLVLEDLCRHHHNAIALQNIDRLTADEWRDILALSESYGVKFLAMHEMIEGNRDRFSEGVRASHIRPYAESQSVLGWSLCDDVTEPAFRDLVEARTLIEEIDPNHPLVALMHQPNAFALFARFFAASGIAHFRSDAPWQVGELVRAHLPLSRGQQFWVLAPAFIRATDTPVWPTSPEMRLMVNTAFANGAKGWFAFCYHNDPAWLRGSCQRSLTGPFLTFSDLWSELGQRVGKLNAVAPLLLKAAPCDQPCEWLATHSSLHARSQLPDAIAPASISCLRGDDFQIACLVSNDTREMTTVHVDIPPSSLKGLEGYDLCDFIQTRSWTPMPRTRHLEMFPGQLRFVLAAKPETCAVWRDVIARRLILDDRRQIDFDLALVRAYGLNIAAVEKMLDSTGRDAPMDDLHTIQRAGDMLLDLIYDTPAICGTRSKIIEANAALCACDGALCLLQRRGQDDPVRQLGLKVIPFARQFTNLRLELRRGRGAAIFEQCEQLASRVRQLLDEIRALSREH